mmetsp:Transcript_8665/g.23499  ORF Transcript_8665/g.23499 Transcript_8665/m.23499 type:complete len:222 (-) Transcript_8665:183-848(-)
MPIRGIAVRPERHVAGTLSAHAGEFLVADASRVRRNFRQHNAADPGVVSPLKRPARSEIEERRQQCPFCMSVCASNPLKARYTKCVAERLGELVAVGVVSQDTRRHAAVSSRPRGAHLAQVRLHEGSQRGVAIIYSGCFCEQRHGSPEPALPRRALREDRVALRLDELEAHQTTWLFMNSRRRASFVMASAALSPSPQSSNKIDSPNTPIVQALTISARLR